MHVFVAKATSPGKTTRVTFTVEADKEMTKARTDVMEILVESALKIATTHMTIISMMIERGDPDGALAYMHVAETETMGKFKAELGLKGLKRRKAG